MEVLLFRVYFFLSLSLSIFYTLVVAVSTSLPADDLDLFFFDGFFFSLRLFMSTGFYLVA